MSSTMVAERTELDRFLESLDAGRMGPRLREALGGSGPTRCHVLDAKYEPGLRAIVLYDAGRLVRGDLTATTTGLDHDSPGVVAPGVRLSRFPHDPELGTLPLVMDPSRLGPALAAELGSGTRCRLRLLRYRPGKRATVLVENSGTSPRLVVKAYHDQAKAAAVAREGPALASAAADERDLDLPPAVAHLPALNAVVHLEVPGTPLDDLLIAPAAGVARAGVAAAGRALAGLHRTQGVTVRHRPVEKELRRFAARAARIATVDARTGAVLGRLVDRLVGLHAALPEAALGPVHGDCKPSQFLCAGTRVWVTDLDHVGISDQAVDVGTFLASLRQLEVRSSTGRPSFSGHEYAALSRIFLASYVDARGHRPRIPAVRWHEAAALERKALRAFARAPRSPLPLTLAAAADRCLDEVVRTT